MDEEMHQYKDVLLVSMPFAGIDIPSIQLGLLESHLKQYDISVKSRHLYLKAADIYGIAHYNYLIYPPNDSYTAQLFFVKYLFPKHYKKNIKSIKAYFDNVISKNNDSDKKYNLTFEEYEEKTDRFYQWVLSNLEWPPYDLIGFTCNYGQFLPSLAIAKHIKQHDKKKHIVFGGSRTIGELGVQSLKCFDFIDTIVSGEGEEALYQLCSYNHEATAIPNLIYRKGKTIITNPPSGKNHLNTSPSATYQSYFQELELTTPETQQYFQYYGRLPIEISRGCWWNKCSFCNLNIQYDRYQEKSMDKILEEINCLSDAYNILHFQLIGNTLPQKNLREFLQCLIQLEKDCTFIAETRADQLDNDDYTLLKDAGIHIIQTGIESFSCSYLKKINKGVGVIDNIASLKYCKEHNIQNHYNLIINYPNEDEKDYYETIKTIQKIKGYLDPPNLCQFRLVYGSPIFKKQDKYGIKNIHHSTIDTLLFPKTILQQNISFIYEFDTMKPNRDSDWNNLKCLWKKEHETRQNYAVTSNQDIDRFIFYFIDGKQFLKIYDKRNNDQINIYTLDSFERAVFLSCLSIITKEHLQDIFHSDPKRLENSLESFIDLGLLYQENNRYLSLPLDLNKCKGIQKNRYSVLPTGFINYKIALKNL
jgi:ribosomal peptide maturation radical SAM protein 1